MASTSPDQDRRKLSVMVTIPCLNEENTVGTVVAGVPKTVPGVGSIDVIVFDDGSTDATADRAESAGAQVVRQGENLGLGLTFQNAVRTAISRKVDIMVNIDGDGQFDPAELALLVAPIVYGRADMVTASRFIDPQLLPDMPRIKLWGNRGVARIVQLLTGRRYHDVSCGFRAFSREALLRMNLFGSFTYTQETFLDLTFKNLRILEVPIKVRGTREFGTSRVAASIPRYAFRSLQIMLRTFVSYRPFQFFTAIASFFLVIGTALLLFLMTHYIKTGTFTPHIWAGFVGGSFGFLGVSTLITGIIGDMLVRMRMNQEEILYHLKNDLS